jgi:hypothetical protein
MTNGEMDQMALDLTSKVEQIDQLQADNAKWRRDFDAAVGAAMDMVRERDALIADQKAVIIEQAEGGNALRAKAEQLSEAVRKWRSGEWGSACHDRLREAHDRYLNGGD